MKGGRTPIHIMRWAPADYVNDAFVRLLVAEEDFATLALYHLVLNWSHMEGGDLPSDPRQLAAILGMRPRRVEKSLARCVDAGKLHVENGRVFHERVVREVAEELEYRELQSERGRRGGRPKVGEKESGGLAPALPDFPDRKSPPAPSAKRLAPSAYSSGAASPAGGKAARETWLTPYCDAWAEVYPDGKVPAGMLSKWVRPLDLEHGPGKVRPELVAYLRATPIEYLNFEKFAAAFGTWVRAPALIARGRPSVPEQNRMVLDEWEQEVVEGKR